MSEKRNLSEGRIKKFIDKVFYWIINGIHNKLVDRIRNDPQVQRDIERFEKAKNKLRNTLRDVAENPDKYLKDLED